MPFIIFSFSVVLDPAWTRVPEEADGYPDDQHDQSVCHSSPYPQEEDP